MKKTDVTKFLGKKYGNWTILGPTKQDSPSRRVECKCSCGVEKSVRLRSLIIGDSKSCGSAVHVKKKHGMRSTRIWQIWRNMKSRCLHKNQPGYRHYGGRGVTVCKEWMEFENFYKDMKDGYWEQGDIGTSRCKWELL